MEAGILRGARRRLFIAATALAPASPMRSSAMSTGRPTAMAPRRPLPVSATWTSDPCPSGGEVGQADHPGPLSARFRGWSAPWRSMRVASVTTPFSPGTLRSARTRTRFPSRRRGRGCENSTFSFRHPEVRAKRACEGLQPRARHPSRRAKWRAPQDDGLTRSLSHAVSAMRLEKPHSLSYHDITRTKVPSMASLCWSWKSRSADRG